MSTARYMYGNDSTTYAATSRTLLPKSEPASGNGSPLYERSSPNTRMIGGMTNGSRVMNSMYGRRRGRRSRTQNAVGTIRMLLAMIVMIPIRNE